MPHPTHVGATVTKRCFCPEHMRWNLKQQTPIWISNCKGSQGFGCQDPGQKKLREASWQLSLGHTCQSLTGVQVKKRLKVGSSGSFQAILRGWRDEIVQFGTAGEVGVWGTQILSEGKGREAVGHPQLSTCTFARFSEWSRVRSKAAQQNIWSVHDVFSSSTALRRP